MATFTKTKKPAETATLKIRISNKSDLPTVEKIAKGRGVKADNDNSTFLLHNEALEELTELGIKFEEIK